MTGIFSLSYRKSATPSLQVQKRSLLLLRVLQRLYHSHNLSFHGTRSNLPTPTWKKVKNIDRKNLAFLDKMGVLLGLKRTQARSRYGSRVYDLKPFYRGEK